MKVLLASLLVALPTAAFAAGPGPVGCPCGADADLVKVRHEIAAAKLDRLLNLSAEQARALVPIVREAQQVKEQLRAEHDRRRPEITRALAMVRDDIRRDGAASETATKALKDARQGLDTAETRQKMKQLRDRAASILTPEQKQRLRQFDPRPLAGIGGGKGMGEGGDGMGPGAKNGRGRHHRMGGKKGKGPLMVVLSPEFLALLESRAR